MVSYESTVPELKSKIRKLARPPMLGYLYCPWITGVWRLRYVLFCRDRI